jgi:gas vesicle protein
MAKKKRSGSGFLIGLVIGIGIGAAATLLLTPRPQLANSIDPTDAGDSEIAPSAASDPLAAVINRVRERYEEALIQGREVYERTRADVLQRYNQAKTQ